MIAPAGLGAYPCGPSESGLDTPHWDGLRRGELLAQQCVACSEWLWGARAICSTCHSFGLEWRPVPTIARVYTWCRTHFPYMSELADLLPYTTVLAEIPEAGGIRMLGLLAGDNRPVAIGDEVTAVIEQPANAEWPVLRWRPTATAAGATA